MLFSSVIFSDMYRYGFQGQETDNEIYGEGNAVSYKYRIHDPRIGRFLSVDPMTKTYPFYSPYAFSGNRVVDAVELEGLQPGSAGKEPIEPWEDGGDIPNIYDGEFIGKAGELRIKVQKHNFSRIVETNGEVKETRTWLEVDVQTDTPKNSPMQVNFSNNFSLLNRSKNSLKGYYGGNEYHFAKGGSFDWMRNHTSLNIGIYDPNNIENLFFGLNLNNTAQLGALWYGGRNEFYLSESWNEGKFNFDYGAGGAVARVKYKVELNIANYILIEGIYKKSAYTLSMSKSVSIDYSFEKRFLEISGGEESGLGLGGLGYLGRIRIQDPKFQ